jgi:hypothetical protein
MQDCFPTRVFGVCFLRIEQWFGDGSRIHIRKQIDTNYLFKNSGVIPKKVDPVLKQTAKGKA